MTRVPTTVNPAERWRWPAVLGARMQTFECVVSKEMHTAHLGADERRALSQLAPLGSAGADAWHRRYSRALIGRHPALAARLPVMQTDVARVALLNQRELAALATLCGVAILWPGIKGAIARDDVNRLRAFLGETTYHWAIRHAPACHTGWLGSQGWTATQIVSACERLGWSTVRAAISDMPAVEAPFGADADAAIHSNAYAAANATSTPNAVIARFLLKLPPSEAMTLAHVEGTALPSSKQALNLCQSLLSFLAYPWLSSFNACR